MKRLEVDRHAKRKAEHRYRAPSWQAAVLIAILALAAFLRFYDLGEESLWVDELASLSFASPKDATGVVDFVRSDDVHPPLYYLVLHYTLKLFGESEAAIRLPSAVAGILTVGVAYLLGRRIYSNAEGLTVALVMAVSWWPVTYSQEARNYAMLLLFATLSSFFWWGCWRGLRERFRRRLPWEAVGYIVSATACSYSHYFGLLLVALQGFALLTLALFLDVSGRRASGRSVPTALWVLLLYVPVALAYLPWASSLLQHSGGEAWFGRPGTSSLEWFITEVFGRSVLLTILCTVLLALGAQRALSRGRGSFSTGLDSSLDRLLPGGLLIAWFAVPVLLTFVISWVWTPLFYPRNLIICLPAAYLLLSRAVVLLSGRYWPPAAVFLTALFLTQLVWGLGYYQTVNNEQYRATARYAASYADEETAFAQCGWGGWYTKGYPDRFDYYFERFGAPSTGPGLMMCTPEKVPVILQRLEAEDKSRLVYLRTHVEPQLEVVKRLREELGPPQKHKKFSALPGPQSSDIWVFEKRR